MPTSILHPLPLLFCTPVLATATPSTEKSKVATRPSTQPATTVPPRKRVRTSTFQDSPTAQPPVRSVHGLDAAIAAGAFASLPQLVERDINTLSFASILRANHALMKAAQWNAVIDVYQIVVRTPMKSRVTCRLYNDLFLAVMKTCSRKNAVFAFNEWKRVVDEGLDNDLFSPRAFNLLFVLLSRLGMVDQALQVKDNCMANGYYLNRYSYNAFLNACAKTLRIEDAFKTLREMAESNVLPDVVSFNVLIACCVKSGDVDIACGILKRMRDWGVSPDVYSYNGVINGMRKSGMLEEAFELVAFMEREAGQHKLVTDIPKSVPSKEEMKRSGIVAELTLAKKDGAEGHNARGKGIEQAVEPDLVTFNTLISGLAGNEPSDFPRAQAVKEHMKEKGIQGNEVTYNALMAVAARSNRVEEAFVVYDEMLGNGIRPNCECFTTLITLCGRAKLIDKAFEVHEHMMACEIEPSVITYNALLTACRWAVDAEAALRVLQVMKKGGCAPDVITYSTVIDSLGRAGRFEDVKTVLEDMTQQGVQPNLVTYTSVISALTRTGDAKGALSIMHDMERHGIEPNVYTFSSLLHGAAKERDAERMFEILDMMTEREIVPTRVTYTTLLRFARDVGDAHVLDRILEYMYLDERLRGTEQLQRIEDLCESVVGGNAKPRRSFEKMSEAMYECIAEVSGRAVDTLQADSGEE